MTTATQPQALRRGSARTKPALRRSKRPQEITGTYQQAIVGRYRPITTHQLAMAWWLHMAGHITRRQLRIYFASHEMAERRRYTGPKRAGVKPLFRLEEIKALVGGRGSKTADRELSADIKRLKALGLVTIEERSITFAASIEQITLEESLDGFWDFFLALPNRQRRVPVPRRTLRALAAGFGRAETAYIIAALIRSVFWHKQSGLYRTDGRTKGSWVAETFGLSRRAVTAARSRLIELGWLEPLEVSQWALNRFGAYDVVNVNWASGDVAAAVGEGSGAGESASPQAENAGESASPCLNSSTSSTRKLRTRRLGSTAPGPAGVLIDSKEGSRKKRSPHAKGAKRLAEKPSIRNVQAEHLDDTEALFELHRQAVGIGLACDSPAGQLDFLSMANRARTRGHKPGALLLWLLKERKSEWITISDEEAASRRLREHHNGPDERRRGHDGGGERQAPPAELTQDELTVQTCLKVALQHRIDDPFRVARQAKNWTRTRWDDAYLNYRTAQVSRQSVDSGVLNLLEGLR